MAKATKKGVSGYGKGGVDTVISVEEVTKQVSAIAQDITVDQLMDLADNDPYVSINNLKATAKWKFCTTSTCMWHANNRSV